MAGGSRGAGPGLHRRTAGAAARDGRAAGRDRAPLPRRRQGLRREVAGLTRVATGARTDTGRVRDGNEDRYLVREERGVTLLAVADGVGGSSGGEVAADAALVELGLRFFGAPPDRATSDALAEAMRDANAAVLRAASASGHRDAATTIVAAAVRADQAIIANLGDSRAYLIRDGARDHALRRRRAWHPTGHLRREPASDRPAPALQRRSHAPRHARRDREGGER
ncbi:MAG: hypothetical protein DME05_02870 [Candidatus Rokuibacteriota bacterium]|nr:MAG: hypothetical protein DME05_02870 [Candidatus Rokubacteria bacterium]